MCSHEIVGENLLFLLDCFDGSSFLLLLLASELVESVSKERENSKVGSFDLNLANLGNSHIAILSCYISVARSDSFIDEDESDEVDEASTNDTTDNDKSHDSTAELIVEIAPDSPGDHTAEHGNSKDKSNNHGSLLRILCVLSCKLNIDQSALSIHEVAGFLRLRLDLIGQSLERHGCVFIVPVVADIVVLVDGQTEDVEGRCDRAEAEFTLVTLLELIIFRADHKPNVSH